jgi:TRAP transporter TAXI family solute receptor
MNKRIFAASLALCLLLVALVGCGGKSQPDASTPGGAQPAPRTQYLTFAAPPASSALYPYWVAVGKAIQTTYPEYQISVSESQGAVDITKRVRTGEADVGNSVSSTDYENYYGEGTFEGDPNDKLRMIWYYEVTAEMFCVSKDSGITQLSDLDGQKFNPGGTGTSAAAITYNIMDLLGIQPNYFEAGQADAADAYANRQVVGTVKLGPVVDSYIMQLGAALPVNLINMSDEEIDTILEAYPYLITVTIPAGTYEGVDTDVKTVGTPQGAQTTSDLPQEDGYKMIKAMLEDGKGVWQAAYPTGADNDYIALTLQSSVPLHAGTVQYLKEKGVDVPANLIPPEYAEK